jgi:hypothetical protein
MSVCWGGRTDFGPRQSLRKDIEDVVVKFLKEYLAAKQDKSGTSVPFGDHGDITLPITRIVVHKDRLIVRLKSDNADEASDSANDGALSIPWQRPPSKRSHQILLPHNASRNGVRPQQFERRARLVSAIARGRRWLNDVVSGRVTTVAQLCAREKCSVRQVNMTISLAFLAPNLVKAAVEGRLPRGIGVERLRDPLTEWSRQFEAHRKGIRGGFVGKLLQPFHNLRVRLPTAGSVEDELLDRGGAMHREMGRDPTAQRFTADHRVVAAEGLEDNSRLKRVLRLFCAPCAVDALRGFSR